MLLLVIILAGLLRFWRLGDAPPGLYRDEAYNGLDALDVLAGETPLFFPANNGREPAYIYLTALAIWLTGRSALAVRLGAAVAGTVTTVLVFALGRSWFDRRVGLLAALLWAITLWPLHLSRIGLRPILLAPLLALMFWLGTFAYRRGQPWLWFSAGLCAGLSAYTYLPARILPLLLVIIVIFLAWWGYWPSLWPGVAWFAGGATLAGLPLLLVLLGDPALAGRASQVSILNEAVNGGDFWGTLWRQGWRSLGLFIWRGDTIWRHNPAGRPLFDIFMAVPWLLGLLYLVRRWRRPAAFTILAWHLVMLLPTILAEDAPHFLRAAGLLPIALFLPALGLSQIWNWTKLPVWIGQKPVRWLVPGPILVTFLAVVSLLTTIRDYQAYSDAPETAYLFEAAAREMAAAIDAEGQRGQVFVEERYRQGWAAIPFLVTSPNVAFFAPTDPLVLPDDTAAVFVWPFAGHDFLVEAWPKKQIEPILGPATRGDLETETYPLYLEFQLSDHEPHDIAAVFAGQLELLKSDTNLISDQELEVTLWWSTSQFLTDSPTPDWTTFVHVGAADQPPIGQSDRPLALGFLPLTWWQPGLVVIDRHRIQLAEPFQPERHEIRIGLYEPATLVRAPVATASGQTAGDSWRLHPR